MDENQYKAIILISCAILLFLVFFLLSDPYQQVDGWLEEKFCIKNGYDEIRYIPQLGRACIKLEPEPIAHLIDCERLNANFLFYFGARPEDCILLKELVVVS